MIYFLSNKKLLLLWGIAIKGNHHIELVNNKYFCQTSQAGLAEPLLVGMLMGSIFPLELVC